MVIGGKAVGKIISIANQKGGVGKTTTSINFASMLEKKNKGVLIIDAEHKYCKFSTYDLLINDVQVINTIQKVNIKKLDVCPTNTSLAGAEVELVNAERREFRLKDKLDIARQYYDFIVIDCPPSLGLITINALVASDSVMIPVQCEYFALEGVGELLKTIELVRRYYNRNLMIEGAVLTMYDPRTRLSNQVVQEINKYFGDKVFENVIPRNVRLSEAPSYGMPIVTYDPLSKGARSYEKLVKEFLKKNNV